MIVSLSWKNIWRNKIRSLVVILAVTVGMFGGTFTMGLMEGVIKSKINDVINNETSHIQIHDTAFMNNYELVKYLDGVPQIINQLEKIPGIESVAARYRIFTTLRTSHGIAGVSLVAVNPDNEMNVTALHNKIIDGEYLNNTKKRNPIVISQKLAEKLDVKVDSKIVVDFITLDSIPVSGLFRVVGIYKTSNGMFDELFSFIRDSDLRKIVGFNENQAHEIVVKAENNDLVDSIKANIENKFPDLDVQTWLNLSPDMAMLVELGDFMLYLIMLIILLALSFGIINTMMMAVMERRKELGMLMAVGMSKKRVFIMIMLETIFLSVVGAIIGMIIAAILIHYTGNSGLDFSQYAQGFEQVGYSAIVYPELNIKSYLIVFVMVVFVAILACLYPARKALKLKPVEALKTDN